jgi:riboflavin kinase / FMN adenylyltransferase
MRVWKGHPNTWPVVPGPVAVTIGVLDGVHLGHRSLLKRLDPSLVRTVLTFDPHPVEVLRPGTHPRLLTTVDERLDLLEGAGVDQVGILDLSDIRALDPARFVEEVLVERMGVAQVVAGTDFRFGKDRAGDTDLLIELGKGSGFAVDLAPLVSEGDEVVSSSRIRAMIEEGRPAQAAVALGSLFRLTGEVIRGDGRGREIGFPTANMEPPARKAIPATGVYAGYATVAGERHGAAINVGVRPTFGGGRLLVESYLLDFDRVIYGEEIVVELAHYLRPELRFDRVDDLVDRMGHDVDETRSLLAGSVGNAG